MGLASQMDPATAETREIWSFGYEYLSEEDPSRLTTGNLYVSAVVKMTNRALQFVDVPPFAPDLYSAANSPNQVSNNGCTVSGSIEFSQIPMN